MPAKDQPRDTLIAILAPMLAAFVACRLYLHLVNPDSDLFIAHYNVHHLYTGTLLAIPAAFVLAFNPSSPFSRRIAQVVLGAGSGLVLDEVIYLIATDGSNAAYLTPVSLWGAIVLIGMATGLLSLLFALARSS